MNAMNKKRGLAGMVAVLFLGLAVLLLSACSDEMEVQQSYPFKVENMPVPTRIIKGETVEIFCVVMFGLINVNILYYSFSTLYQMCNLRQSL